MWKARHRGRGQGRGGRGKAGAGPITHTPLYPIPRLASLPSGRQQEHTVTSIHQTASTTVSKSPQLHLLRSLSQRATSHAHPFTMIGAPPSPSINPPPSNPSSLLSASPRSPRMALPPMDRTSSTSSAVSMASPSLVTLHLISQFTYPQGISGSPDEDRAPPSVIRAKRSHTIAKIKNAVHVNWPGRPKVEGIRLIYSGRLLSDHETVGQVVPEAQSEVSCCRPGYDVGENWAAMWSRNRMPETFSPHRSHTGIFASRGTA